MSGDQEDGDNVLKTLVRVDVLREVQDILRDAEFPTIRVDIDAMDEVEMYRRVVHEMREQVRVAQAKLYGIVPREMAEGIDY